MSALPASPSLRARPGCAECGAAFDRVHWRTLFCSAACRTAFGNRMTVRGRKLTSLVMAVRETRGGSRGDVSTGREARLQSDRLMDKWTAEDRQAGRMTAATYLALRNRMGFAE